MSTTVSTHASRIAYRAAAMSGGARNRLLSRQIQSSCLASSSMTTAMPFPGLMIGQKQMASTSLALPAAATIGAFTSTSHVDIRRLMSSSSPIKRIGTDTNPNMSSAVVHGGVLTTMGVVDLEGKTLEEQTKNILAKIDALLEEGGTDKSKLLTANIWLKNIATDFKPFNEIWVNWIHADNKPIRACVEANLAFPALLVEIQVTAAV